jgi:hypothetical protein
VVGNAHRTNSMRPALNVTPLHAANRLGLLYRHEATQLPWRGPIWDVHVHLNNIHAAHRYFEVADRFGIEHTCSMTNLEEIDDIRAEYGERVSFIAVPNYQRRFEATTFTTDWQRRIEQFADKGVKICKFWGAPRGRDLHPALRPDSTERREAMKLASSLGMMFMVHIADPDTWFATHYSDHRRYGTKAEQYDGWRRELARYPDQPWLAAHMAGDPEHLDHLQELLDAYPQLHLDTSATKWMVRELSKAPAALRSFCQRNPERVLFGSDIVAAPQQDSFDLFASRYWSLRTLFETDYHGLSPITDPDLALVDPACPPSASATLHGARLDPATLGYVYHVAARRLLNDYL